MYIVSYATSLLSLNWTELEERFPSFKAASEAAKKLREKGYVVLIVNEDDE